MGCYHDAWPLPIANIACRFRDKQNTTLLRSEKDHLPGAVAGPVNNLDATSSRQSLPIAILMLNGSGLCRNGCAGRSLHCKHDP